MTFDNPDFIIKAYKDEKTGKKKIVLRRYKGHEIVVTIPDGVTKIADLTFGDDIEPNRTITKIIIPDSVKEITKYAFKYCMVLKEIEFPKNLKRFDINFSLCPSLTEVYVPESVETLGSLMYSKTLKTIHLGGNITEIDFQSYWRKHGKNLSDLKKDKIIDLFRPNPAYEVTENGFLINKIHKTTLLIMDKISDEIHVPEEIEVISANTFAEFDSVYDMSDLEKSCLKKVFIPKTVKEIRNFAFMNCNALEDVIYDGFSKDLKVSKGAFFLCRNFHEDGSDIICKDRPKNEKKKQVKVGWDRLTRIFIIDRAIRSGMYPNIKKLIELCKKHGIDATEITIYRDFDDILFFSKTYCLTRTELISYDSKNKGFYYTQDFELDIEGTLLGL